MHRIRSRANRFLLSLEIIIIMNDLMACSSSPAVEGV